MRTPLLRGMVAAAAVVLTLAGCGGGSKSGTNAPAP